MMEVILTSGEIPEHGENVVVIPYERLNWDQVKTALRMRPDKITIILNKEGRTEMKSCKDCKCRAFVGWDGIIEYCMWYEMATSDEDCKRRAVECERYEKGTPYCFEKEEYCPSSTNGDYSPSSPWNAPGMSIRDFI